MASFSFTGRRPVLTPVAAVCAGLMAVAPAFAQEAQQQPQQLETVKVTGIRHGIESAVALKRNQDSIVEAISAEDIGKLPDVSIADSIARLPGLTAQRINGRPSAISIRGLGPDYGGAVLNGREVVSSSSGRAAEYDQFPAELVSKVLVYKTPDALLMGQGLSGTIDIRPALPLDFSSRQVVLHAGLERNSNGKLIPNGTGATGSSFSGSYIDQFANRTIGVLIGYARNTSPRQEKDYESWAYGDYVGQWGAGATGVPAGAAFSQGFTASQIATKTVRDGLMGVVEFRPNEAFRSEVDLFYSKFTQDTITNQWTGDLGLWGSPASAYSNVQTSSLNGNTVVSSGTVANGHNIIDDKNLSRSDDIRSIGWKSELKLDDKWTAMVDLGASRAKRHERLIESIAAGASGAATYQFAGLDTKGDPSWSTNQDLTDPSVMQLTNNPDWAQLVTPSYTDEIKSVRLQAERKLDLWMFRSLTFGVNQTRREKNVNSAQFKLTLPTDNVTLPADALRGTTHIQMGGIDTHILNWDVPSVMSLYTQVPKDPWRAQGQSYSVRETVSTGFAKLDLDGQVGSIPVHGNLGLQAVHTRQISDGFAWNDGGGTAGAPGAGSVIPVTGGATYNDYLPSLNLVFELSSNLYARFGVAKSLARPRMDDMRAGADQPKLNPVALGSTFGLWSAGAGGKPDLKPWRATSYDFSLEKYLNKSSYLSLALFDKELKTFIYQQTTTRDFSGFPNYSDLTPGCPVSNTSCDPNLGTISAMANGEGGRVYGAELTASLDGGLLSPMLSGYGVIASLSSTKNKLPNDNNGNKINLDGFSGRVNSLTVYYEKGGFSARVSRRYRSAFTASTQGILLATEYSSHIEAEAAVDAQIGYAFEHGPMKGLSLILQGYNLTNQAAVQTKGPEVGGVGTGLLPWKYNTYGRTLSLGATYKF